MDFYFYNENKILGSAYVEDFAEFLNILFGKNIFYIEYNDKRYIAEKAEFSLTIMGGGMVIDCKEVA